MLFFLCRVQAFVCVFLFSFLFECYISLVFLLYFYCYNRYFTYCDRARACLLCILLMFYLSCAFGLLMCFFLAMFIFFCIWFTSFHHFFILGRLFFGQQFPSFFVLVCMWTCAATYDNNHNDISAFSLATLI